jgi:hypothetical protein
MVTSYVIREETRVFQPTVLVRYVLFLSALDPLHAPTLFLLLFSSSGGCGSQAERIYGSKTRRFNCRTNARVFVVLGCTIVRLRSMIHFCILTAKPDIWVTSAQLVDVDIP